jgi:hypothetical protein
MTRLLRGAKLDWTTQDMQIHVFRGPGRVFGFTEDAETAIRQVMRMIRCWMAPFYGRSGPYTPEVEFAFRRRGVIVVSGSPRAS